MTPIEFMSFLRKNQVNTLLTADWESYYSQDYSLSKLTTEEYIRGDLFKAHMLGYKVNADPAKILMPRLPINRLHSDKFWNHHLDQFDWSSIAMIAHNNYFDAGILGLRYNRRPALYLDTLTMARALYGNDVPKGLGKLAELHGLGEKGWQLSSTKGVDNLTAKAQYDLAEYCAGSQAVRSNGNVEGDVNLCWQLFWIMLPYFTEKHLQCIDIFIRMFTEPRLVADSNALLEYAQKLEVEQDTLLLGLELGSDVKLIRDELRKTEVFAELLAHFGVEPPMKWSNKTKTRPEPILIYAFAKTDPGMQELLEHDDPKISAMAHAKLSLNSTGEQQRAINLMGMASRGSMSMPIQWFGAHTGRCSGLSGSKINVQNFGRKSPIRSIIKAPHGYAIVGADSGQIQARLTAWLAQQEDLVEDFRAQGTGQLKYDDVYCQFASEVLFPGQHITNKPEHFAQRFLAKTCILALSFGMGHKKYRQSVQHVDPTIDEYRSKDIVNAYRERFWLIKQLWKLFDSMLFNMTLGKYHVRPGRPGIITPTKRGITLPDGTTLKYTNLKVYEVYDNYREAMVSKYGFNKNRNQIQFIYGGMVTENVAQALEQCIMNDSMIELKHRGYDLVLQEHDCLYAMVPINDVEETKRTMQTVLSTSRDYYHDLPLSTDVAAGITLAEAKP